MRGTTGTDHAPSENAADTLVSKTDAKNGDAPRKLADDGSGNAGFHWRAGAGRNDDCARLERNEIGDADRVISDDFCLCTQHAKITCNIEYEGIVIIDDENQDAPGISESKASKRRCALASVFSYSASGVDIAVIPPPA